MHRSLCIDTLSERMETDGKRCLAYASFATIYAHRLTFTSRC